jgi:predicted nucleotide-binding protein (sugar kinase/HSP70/actin superfamily)
MIRKLQQQLRPYEKTSGETDRVYSESLRKIVASVENNTKGLVKTLEEAEKNFSAVELLDIPRKPIVSIVGEIFMRDNRFCNGNIVARLEALGAETLMSPFSEWFIYSTYRYTRDSKWKGDYRGILKSKLQEFSQTTSYKKLLHAVEELVDEDKDIPLKTMLELAGPYIHKDYDGDPVMAIGTAAAHAEKGVSGICNILPFTCMPGTLICSVADMFRKDHRNIPWMDYAYDGQDDATLETRLQAFMYQAKEFQQGKRLPADSAEHRIVRG